MPPLGMGQAHSAVAYAIKKSVLPPINKDTKCVDCGGQAKHYDHRDYNKPLEVEAVCQKCNMRRGPAIPNLKYKLVIQKHYLFKDQMLELMRLNEKTGIPASRTIRDAIDQFLNTKRK